MSTEKYVELKHVKELIELYRSRDSFNDWSNQYEEYDKEVKKKIEFLDLNAKELK